MLITPVILAGGYGSRLWPLSRQSLPKQLVPLVNNKTPLENTLLLAKKIHHSTQPIVIGQAEQRFIIAQQIDQTLHDSNSTILLEPDSYNTAVSIALVSLFTRLDKNSDPLLLVLPSDHFIEDENAFIDIIRNASKNAIHGKLITFGINPTSPKTSYGYIKIGTQLSQDEGYLIDKFVEKPEIKEAENFITSQQYFWNSGIFLFHASNMINELKKLAPEILSVCEKAISAFRKESNFVFFDRQDYWHNCPNISIDKAVFEKTDQGVVFPFHAKWADLGCWKSLYEVGEKDNHQNVSHGNVVAFDTKQSYLYSDKRLLVTIGLQNCLVIETSDAVLVANLDKTEEIKEVVQFLLKKGVEEAKTHPIIYRPWGYYEVIEKSERYQVKHIHIKPGEVISLQMHYHRSEHWIIVGGSARVTRDDEILLVSENESVYIPQGVKHRLENPGKLPLHLIEIQTGSYLGEDDIVRFEDRYNRK